MVNVLRILTLFSLLIFGSCIDIDPWSKDWPAHNNMTQDGRRVWLPDNLSQSPALVMVWVDIRVSDWIAQRGPEYGFEYVAAVACNATFWIIDDYRFPSPWSPTGYAAGDVSPGEHYSVRACIYTGAYGQLASDGMGLPVIGHELDHRLDISH